jgi:hypothetical protein
VPDAEVEDWQEQGLLHAEAGLDWKEAYVCYFRTFRTTRRKLPTLIHIA